MASWLNLTLISRPLFLNRSKSLGNGYLVIQMLGGSLSGLRLGNRWYNSSLINGINGLISLRPMSKHVYRTSLAQVVQPVVEQSCGDAGQIVGSEARVAYFHCFAKAAQHPFVHGSQIVERVLGYKSAAQTVHHGKFGRIPQLVTKVSVALNSQHIQIDVSTLGRVSTQRKSKRICPALGFSSVIPSITSSGSIMFPSDLLILRPWASRMIA
ncbi:hypothetical protein BpHYR1_017326 [Brachionus plicatilis]|uniref:Uncharacterized protein n=1 Tax=Brachionus plicatilis TaxID=10195 RepID=A0A3M7Q168_BRAPC|nr:hypothetical protein BpHYR1_017326 [Brachionus plicatilis]